MSHLPLLEGQAQEATVKNKQILKIFVLVEIALGEEAKQPIKCKKVKCIL